MVPLAPPRFSTTKRFAELLAELVGDQAADDVGGAAGRKADHDAHRLRRPGLRKGEKRQRCQQAEEGAAHGQSIMNPKGGPWKRASGNSSRRGRVWPRWRRCRARWRRR